jgi:hypothetical protein
LNYEADDALRWNIGKETTQTITRSGRINRSADKGSDRSPGADVQSVTLTLEKAYEYDRGRAQNSITVKQWEILLDPNRNLFGGFIRRWREKGSLRPAYIAEKKPDIAEAFDQIIQLERGKPKSQ